MEKGKGKEGCIVHKNLQGKKIEARKIFLH